MEETERTQSERSNFTILDKYSQPTTIEMEQPPSWRVWSRYRANLQLSYMLP